MRGRLPVLLLAAFAVAIAFAGSRGRDESPARETRRQDPGRRDPRAVRVLAGEEEPARSADRALQRRAPPGRRAPGARGGPVDELRRGRVEDPRRRSEARRVVARLDLLGPAARVRGRSPARARGDALAGADAGGDRDVGADGARPGLATQEARVRRLRPARPLGRGLGRLRAPRVGRVQARPHQPRLLDLGPVGGRGGVLLRDGQAGGAHGARRGGPAGARDRPRPRARDRPLRGEHAADRGTDAQARAGVRIGRRYGGDHPARLQPEAQRSAAAGGDLSARGYVLLRQPVHRARRRLGDAGAAARRRGAAGTT